MPSQNRSAPTAIAAGAGGPQVAQLVASLVGDPVKLSTSINTTMIYADYSPSEHENAMAERAFGSNSGSNLSETQINSGDLTVPEGAEDEPAEPSV